jgi:hypothetical protein
MRAQIQSQIFFYILGAMVMGLLLLIGVRSIGVLTDNQCSVEETQFATDIKSAIEKNKQWGINKVQNFALPCDYSQVCFVSRKTVDEVSAPGSARFPEGKYPTIIDSVESDSPVNVFVEKDGGFIPLKGLTETLPVLLPETDSNSAPIDPVVCFSGSPVRIRFVGKGQTAELKPYE